MGLTARELTALAAPPTTTATAPTTTAVASAAAAAARGRAFFARTGFVNGQGATLDFLAGKGLDCSFSGLRRCHGDKAKSARPAAHAVGDEVNLGNRAMLLEQILQVILGGVEGKISHVQFRIHFISIGFRNAGWPPGTVPVLSGFKSSLNRVHLRIYHVGSLSAI
jgi:hypothetical protein